MSSDIDWLPPAIGLGVGLGEGLLAVTGAEAQLKHVAALYRLGVFGLGLVRELRGGGSEIAVDINYSLMTAALALEASAIPAALNGGGFSALADVQPGAAASTHAHGATCNTCASRKPVVAAPLLTPAESLRGYH